MPLEAALRFALVHDRRAHSTHKISFPVRGGDAIDLGERVTA
jgi:hypothetical protein